MDRLITLLNVLLSEESLDGRLYFGKVKDELLMEEDIEPLIVKLFEPLIQDEAYFLHDVGKTEIFTLVHRAFRAKSLKKRTQKKSSKFSFKMS